VRRLKILVIAGASGGHIFPALGFLDALKNKDKNIDTLLVIPKKITTSYIEDYGCKVNYISVTNIKLRFNVESFSSIFMFFKGCWESLFIILKFRPRIVVGFGSLATLPMISFAWMLGIKTIIHEQNVIPGKANNFLAKFVDRVALSFVQTREYFKNYQKKIVVTGNPIRKELSRIDKDRALSFFGFNNDKFTILVMGGSAGSHKINIEFFKTATTMPNREKLQVIHLTGTGDFEMLKNSYKGLNSNVKLFSFLKSVQYAYSAADLVISRAGATTIAEIIFFKLPAILIPYPYAYKHQLSNAELLGRAGLAMIIEDNEFDVAMLKQVIGELISNPQRLAAMRDHYSNTFLLSRNDLLVDETLSLCDFVRK